MRKQALGSLLLLFIASACLAVGQGHTGLAGADTALMNRIVLIDPGISLGRASFLLPPSLGSEISFNGPRLTSPGSGFGTLGPFIGAGLEPRVDLVSPLRLQMENEKMSPFQTVLGAMEFGAVAYMAYRQIKK